MRKQKIPITALSMPENIPGIEYKWLRNRWMLSFNNKITVLHRDLTLDRIIDAVVTPDGEK